MIELSEYLTKGDSWLYALLSAEFKKQAKQVIDEHINWLTTITDTEHLVISWKEMLHYVCR